MRDTALWGGLLILILCHQSQSFCETVNKDPCIEEAKKTWSEASQSCNLVVSNTTLRVGVPITNIPVLRHRSSDPINRSDDVHWIGAIGTFTPWFELAGCNLYRSFLFIKQWRSSSNLGPVAQCHQICENRKNSYKEFGINETHCFCSEDNYAGVIKNLTCRLQNSENVKNDLVGTGNDQRLVPRRYVFALYRKIKNITEIDDKLGECLMETKKGNKTYPCDAADITQRTRVERYRHKTNNNSLSRWRPYVRRLIISWKKDISAEQKASVCIAVRYQNGSYELLPRRCDETHTSICKNAGTTTGTNSPRTSNSNLETERGQTTVVHQIEDTTTQHTTSSDLKSSMRHTTFVHNMTSTTSINRHRDKDSTTTPRTTRSSYGTSRGQSTFGQQITDSSPVDRHNDNNEPPDSTLPLIIGSVVGGLLCIVIVGIIIVIFIKRRRPDRKEIYHPTPTEKVHFREMKEDRKPHLSMEKEEPSPTENTIDYDTMMSVKKRKITEDSKEYGKLVPNGEADVYNHTWDKPITIQLTDYVYSSIMSGNDANVYDHCY
ncbi:uncharacterized protein LOC134229382 isoform X1 [Saccostrea cucullata]|uniref:uncharacterized protein LOC134229382 isoform X1 n=1 Tax=Saccostrea cuccullata TaxID=36930 RepID=UPI002ED47028